jgi:hypothetical protein
VLPSGVVKTRMLNLLGVLGLAALVEGRAAVPATGTAAVPGPRIQFAEQVHDFGRINAGEVRKHEFIFTNTGTAALQITEVRPGCGCTTAGAWDKRVEPGQTGRIPLQFNSAGFSGSISKGATVTCNDPTQTNVYLTLKGAIWRPIEITPQSVYFSLPEESVTNDVRVVRIVNNLDAPLVLSEPECTNHTFRAELTTVSPGKEFEVRVSVRPPVEVARPQGTVTLKTTLTNTPLLTIPVYAYVQPAISVVPSQVMLPAGPLNAAMQPTVTIRNTGTNALTLSDAAINLDGATVTLKEVQPGRVFTLALSVPSGAQLTAGQRVTATVKSNHPRYPVIQIPVFQSTRAVTSTPTPAVRSTSSAPAARPRPSAPAPPPMLARPPEPVAR